MDVLKIMMEVLIPADEKYRKMYWKKMKKYVSI